MSDVEVERLFNLKKKGLKRPKCQKTVHRRGINQYQCCSCQRNISIWEGTIFEGLRTPISARAELLWLLANNSLTNKQAQRSYSVNANTFQNYQLRVFTLCQEWMGKQRLEGVVEVDETYLGKGLGRSAIPGVFIAIEKRKNGRVIALPENSFTKNSCHKLVNKTVASKSTVLTDGWRGYNDLEKIVQNDYQHTVCQDYRQLPQVHSSINHLKKILKELCSIT